MIVHLNDSDLEAILLFRVAISEDTMEARTSAISGLREVLTSDLIEYLGERPSVLESATKQVKDLHRFVFETSKVRREGENRFKRAGLRYDAKNERRLNVAECIGRLVWDTIKAGEFRGLHTSGGILASTMQIGHDAGVSGAKDKDTVRKLWKTYRGVVHLGMAINFCEEEGIGGVSVMEVAEEMRFQLSNNCPKGTKKPYVAEADQMKFVYR